MTQTLIIEDEVEVVQENSDLDHLYCGNCDPEGNLGLCGTDISNIEFDDQVTVDNDEGLCIVCKYTYVCLVCYYRFED